MEEFQTTWIEIINQSQPNAVIGVIYRNPHKQKHHKFNTYLQETLTKQKNNNKKIFICGDFNYDLLKHETNIHVGNFLNIMFENFLQPHIIQPTRFVNKQTPSLIDNIYSNSLENNCISGNLISKISDHLPNFIISDSVNYKFDTKLTKTERDFRTFSDETFLRELSNNLSDKFDQATGNINNKFDSFHNCFIQTLNKHAPYKTITRKESKSKLKPWLSQGIIKKYTNKKYSI